MVECIFCDIAGGQSAADVVLDTKDTIFFRDINPKARIHIIGIPKKHISSVDTVGKEDREIIGKLVDDISEAAMKASIDPEMGYRVITNVGTHAGQDVKHMHWHVMGGESLGPLRCEA